MHRKGVFSALALAVALAAPAAHAQELIAVDDYPVTTPYVIRDYDASGVPLLGWFNLFYVFSDHHLRQMHVLPVGDDIHISFLDDDANDTIGYSVGHFGVPGLPWNSELGSCSGPICVEQLDKPEGAEFVLIGFSVWFTGGDHHLHRFQIEENNGFLAVTFQDKHYDRNIAYRVDYTWVPHERIASMGDWGDGGKDTVHAPAGTVPSGPVVLQGFDLSYIELDHHVQAIAVSPDAATLRDKNDDDAIRAQVRWVELLEGRPGPKVDDLPPPDLAPPEDPPFPPKFFDQVGSVSFSGK